jgi:hypothetical protein
VTAFPPRYIRNQAALTMKFRTVLLVAASLALGNSARAQTLVYALSYADTPAGFRARFPYGALRASESDRVAMIRNLRKTEIYSLNLADGKRTLLFSDEGMSFEIRPDSMSIGSGKAYVAGVDPAWRNTASPGVTGTPQAMYELRLDGSNKIRRLFEIDQNLWPLVLNPQGTRAVFSVNVNEQEVISIYSLPDWKLLHTFELAKLLKSHCPACSFGSYGWLADGARLFLEVGVDDDDDDKSTHPNAPGTYIASEEGADLGILSPDVVLLPPSHNVPPTYIIRRFLGQLPDGAFLFEENLPRTSDAHAPRGPFLVISDAGDKVQRQFPETTNIGVACLTSSGKYLAYLESRRQNPKWQWETHLMVKDLLSGEEKDLLTVPPQNPPSSLEPNVTLHLLGWAGNN